MKIWFTALFLISDIAFAQLDPSSGLLLNSDSKSSTRENGLDSGRYMVRPHSDLGDRKKLTQPRSTDRVQSEKASVDKITEKMPDKINDKPSEKVAEKTAERAENKDDGTSSKEADEAPGQAQAPANTPAVNTPALEPKVFADFSSKETKMRVSSVDEKRKNLIELNLAPVFIYNHSSSELSSRNYSTSNLAYSIEGSAWLQPNFALHGHIINSLAASVNDSYARTKNANLTQQWLSGGFLYRHFLTSKRNAPSLTLGVDYQDYQFQVDSDSQIRNRLETSGINLSLVSELPQSSSYSWELGFDFMPKAKHRESLTTANLQAGDNPDADVISLSVGGRFYIDSSNQMFWRISERLEKDQFTGSTSKPDPASGDTLTNVGVTNSFTMIQIGYTWGN